MKKYYALQPARFRLDGGAMYGIIPKPLWEKKSPPDKLNRIDLSLRLVLIEEKDELILLDTGIGDYHGDQFDDRFDVRGPTSPLIEALRALGKKPEDITDLIVGHLHFDHVGGIVQKSRASNDLEVTFPKARLHLHNRHYDYALNPTARDAGSFQDHYFLPAIDYYKDQNKLIWYDGEEGIYQTKSKLEFLCSHGHTPYLMHPFDDQFIYLADIIPTSHHVALPWVMGYDIYPGKSVEDKKRILNFIHEKNLKVIFEHDTQYWGAEISPHDKYGYVIKESLKASSDKAFELKMD